MVKLRNYTAEESALEGCIAGQVNKHILRIMAANKKAKTIPPANLDEILLDVAIRYTTVKFGDQDNAYEVLSIYLRNLNRLEDRDIIVGHIKEIKGTIDLAYQTFSMDDYMSDTMPKAVIDKAPEGETSDEPAIGGHAAQVGSKKGSAKKQPAQLLK